jgi:thiol-disulfide isomerase/thioredoxin
MFLALLVGALTIHQDDFAAAQKRAIAEKKAIVVDLWAPWCHACLSMQHYVFPDPRVQALDQVAVFLAVDTEKEANKALVDRFRPTAWPTFLVLDSKGERVLGRLPGSATPAEFATFVTQAAQAKKPGALQKADEALTRGSRPEAEKLYQAALGDKALSPSEIGRAAMSLSLIYMQNGRADLCALEAERFAKAAAGTYFAPGLRATAAGCLLEKHAPDKKKLTALRAALMLDLSGTPLEVDDKSDLYATIAEVADALDDKTGATAARQARIALLEDAARAAPDPESARTFDAHRTEAYLDLDRADDAIAMLSASEKLAPDDYNPPARLAQAYLRKGDLTNARAAIARAKSKVYGPRTAVVLLLEGDIEKKAGDKQKAKLAYTAAKAILAKQAPTLSVQRRLQTIEKNLGAL